VVIKVHPGTKRSILRSGGSSSEALPGAVESMLGKKRLSLKLLKLIVELCIQSHPEALEDHPKAMEILSGSLWFILETGRHRASLRSSGWLPWSRGGSSWSHGISS
jgi:hypothetical protein